MRRIKCPRCAHIQAVTEAEDGDVVACVECGQKVRVPRRPSELSVVELVQAGPPAAPPSLPQSAETSFDAPVTGQSFLDRMRVPVPLRMLPLLFMLLGLGLGIYWWSSYRGPYRAVVEWEMQTLGRYFPFYTGLLLTAITAALFTAVSVGLLLAVSPLLRRKDTGALPVYPAGDSPAAQAVDRWLQEHKGYLLGGLIGIGLAVVGGYLLFSGLTAGDLKETTAAALEAGRAPPSRWLTIHGRLHWQGQLLVGDSSPGGKDRYVPLVSPTWRPGNPVAAYVKITERAWNAEKAKLQRPGIEGTVESGGLSGPLRVEFERRGYRPADNYLVLDFAWVPTNSTTIGRDLLILGGVVLGLTILIWILLAMRRMRG